MNIIYQMLKEKKMKKKIKPKKLFIEGYNYDGIKM